MAAVAVAIACLAVASAGAHAATAHVPDPAGDAPAADVIAVDVSWDGVTLTVAATLAAPALTSLQLVLSDAANRHDERTCSRTDDVLVFDADGASARLLETDLDVDPVAAASWSGATVTFAFSSPELAEALRDRDPFACLSGEVDGDRFAGAFAGKILRITSKAASDALGQALARRWRDRAVRRWLRCPRQQIRPETAADYAWVSCRFELRAGTRVHSGTATLSLIAGTLVASQIRGVASSKRVRSCRVAATRDGLAKRLRYTGRTLRASASLGCAGPARHMAAFERELVRRYPRAMQTRFAVRERGRATAGFDERFRFACRARKHGSRYAVTCANRLGDRFVHHVTVTQKPKPKPPPPPPAPPSGGGGGCDPNYAGACLNPNASDYDCAGGSGNGPLYVQGPITVVGNDHFGLDSDGDGIACES